MSPASRGRPGGAQCEAMAVGPGDRCMRRGAVRCSWVEDGGRVTRMLCTTHRFIYAKKKPEFTSERRTGGMP